MVKQSSNHQEISVENDFPLCLKGLGYMSEEAFFDFCQANKELRIEKEANGNIIIMAPTNAKTGKFSGEAYGQLYMWNRKTELGVTFDSSTGFTMPDGSVKSPDATWIQKERWEQLTEEEQSKFSPIVPDFVLELMSFSDKMPPTQAKMEDYISQGVRLAFLVIPYKDQVFIYRQNGTIELKEGFTQQVGGEDVLPGFQLDLSRLS